MKPNIDVSTTCCGRFVKQSAGGCCDSARKLQPSPVHSCKHCERSAVDDFKELEESLRGWASCSRAIRRALLPEAAVEHSQKVLPPDTRVRSWQPDQQPNCGLLYRCSQAQVEFGNPAGGLFQNKDICLYLVLKRTELSACDIDQLISCHHHQLDRRPLKLGVGPNLDSSCFAQAHQSQTALD